MAIRTFSLVLFAGLAAVNLASAAAIMTFGNNAELHAKAGVEYRYETNIFRDEEGFQVIGTGPGGNGVPVGVPFTVEEESDSIFLFTPGIEFNLGDPATNYFNADFGYRIKRYANNSRLDSNLPTLGAEGFFNNQVVQLESKIRWQETDSGTSDVLDANLVGRLIEREQLEFNNYGEYFFSTKTSFGAGFDYFERDFITPGFSNSYYYAIPLDVYYAVTPKIDVSVGYRYRRTNVSDNPLVARDQGVNFNDHFFNVGVRGELAPKLTGSVKLGYIDRSVTNVEGPPRSSEEEDGTFSIDTGLSYQYSPKFGANIGVSRDFDSSSADGTTIVRNRIRLGAEYAYNQMWSARAFFGYAKNNYRAVGTNDREDDYFDLGFSVLYTPNEYMQFSAGYTYQDNDSNLTGLSFDNNQFRLTGTFRY